MGLYITEDLRALRGGSQSRLMRASDGNHYVVKFRDNPQGSRILANELLASRLAEQLGLPVPLTCPRKTQPQKTGVLS